MTFHHLNEIKAIILDLDGVVTRTADLHEKAWKKMFDPYIKQWALKNNRTISLFTHEDYKLYVDGKLRFQGADDFLRSRDIILSFGYPDDPPGFETICSLANRKNIYYKELLQSEGVHVFSDTQEMLTIWKILGYKTGLFSSSKNCREVISRAGLTDYFDTIVDGHDLDVLHMKGKPDPSMLLYAAEKLGVQPSQAIIIEDAPSGIEAGKRGNFRMVIGIERNGSSHLLYKFGADHVVSSLKELRPVTHQKPVNEVPLFNRSLFELVSSLSTKPITLFLDYDGTLAPITSRPEAARLSESVRSSLVSLSRKCTVAIVSGRDREDVKQHVNIDNIYYAGCHGLEISGPDGLFMAHPFAHIAVPYIQNAERFAAESMGTIPGILIERKKYILTVHFRMVPEKFHDTIKREVGTIHNNFPNLRLTEGKMVYEFRPDIEWDKGHALLWMIGKMPGPLHGRSYFYCGDDITDEDAFKEIKEIGISIIVGSHGLPTFADYRVENVEQIHYFLEELDRMI